MFHPKKPQKPKLSVDLSHNNDKTDEIEFIHFDIYKSKLDLDYCGFNDNIPYVKYNYMYTRFNYTN